MLVAQWAAEPPIARTGCEEHPFLPPGQHFEEKGRYTFMEDWPRRDGLPEIMDWSAPLFWCLRDSGCKEIIYSNDWITVGSAEELERYGNTYVVATPDDVTPDEYGEIMNPVSYAEGEFFGPSFAFDASGGWAATDFRHTDYGDNLIGCTPEFYDRYCGAAGGEHFVRAWYYWWSLGRCARARSITVTIDTSR